MELYPAARIAHEPERSGPCERYLDLLGLEAAPSLERDAPLQPDERIGAMHALHHALAGDCAVPENPAYGSILGRVELVAGRNTVALAPPVNRGSMVPHPWRPLNPFKRWAQSVFRRRKHWVARQGDGEHRRAWPAPHPPASEDDVVDGPDPRGRWQHQGNIRRVVLLVLMFLQTALATWFMSQVLPYQGTAPLEIAILALFAILFCWVSAGFWTAMTGFLVMLRGTDPFVISSRSGEKAPIDPSARTAMVMPICNEDVARVMAGLRATYESLSRTGELSQFDFFILSDSNESDTCVAEAAAWASLCRAVDGFGRIFYRRRRRRVKRKSGNIDDFCRRWGKNYRYMIVLDADSVMSGEALVSLVRLMEANPGAGIIQTAPIAAGRDTLYARVQQFATRVYGPLFTAGLHYWQLGESHYWGHNAIIRLDPFMRHCALAPLPGRGSLAGEILSHDFVEAALMRRAGWSVWIAYDLDGSYEEMPPNLLDELKRDRRWCHGNLMNFRLFPARGMHPVHRAVFVTGVMAYLSAPLWLLFLALSTALLAMHTLVEPTYFIEPRQLFPIWPQWHPEKAIALFSATATVLFLPKLLSVLAIWARGAEQFGGKLRVLAAMLLELLLSMALAPVRMLFHTHFVIAAFLGWEVRWKSPPRGDTETSWGEGLRKHGLHTLLGLAWGAVVYWLNPSFLPWLLPIAGSLVLSVPLSVWSSRVTLGRRLRRRRLFVIPEEVDPPSELRQTFAYTQEARTAPDFIDAVVDPAVNAVACFCARARLRRPKRSAHTPLVGLALESGPESLDEKGRYRLLNDPQALSRLHFEVWTSPRAHPAWRRATTRGLPA